MRENLPFRLPRRAHVTRVRQVDAGALLAPSGPRRQPMRGFNEAYVDIVDYIVRITHEIWVERAVGRIRDTYAPDCAIHSALGTSRGVEAVIAGTLATLDAFPDGEQHHLSVTWEGDENDFYTSHLGWSRSTNRSATAFGPATGARVGVFFVADCISRENKIHTEWLARDGGAIVRGFGLDLHDCARRLAESSPAPELSANPAVSSATPDAPADSIAGYFAHHFGTIWGARRFDRLADHYEPGAIAHWPGGRVAMNARGLGTLLLALFASLPDAAVTLERVSWAEETDGLIAAARWCLQGTMRAGGLFGEAPAGRAITVPGMSHFRFGVGGRIAEEWTVFDEVGVLAQAYRA